MLLIGAQLEQTGSMRSRYPSSSLAYSFGPGPWTPAIKAIIIANIVVFLATSLVRELEVSLWLNPHDVVHGQLWRLVTYMFVHAGVFHILFNMLSLWMFGVELERMWGTRYFLKFYFVCGVGAAMTTVLLSFVPGSFGQQLYYSLTIGASGAVYGILLAYALYFPSRPIYYMMIFPIPAKYFVAIIGAVSLISSMSGPGGGIAHTTHLGGLVAGYLYLKGGRIHPLSEIKSRYLKWKINRTRRK